MSIDSASQTGELIFQHRRGWLALVSGIAAAVLGPAIAVIAPEKELRLNGVVCTVIGIIFICVGLHLRGKVLRVYERGLEDNHRFVRYDDVEMLQASITTTDTEVGTGTDYKLTFEGHDAAGPFRIKFRSGNLGSKVQRASVLIQAAGEPVRRRMKKCLEDVGSVAWTEGLVISSSSMRDEALGIDIPYWEIEDIRLDNGYLVVRAANGYKKRITTSAKNFYPGYWLLLDQVNQGQRGES